MRGLTAGVSFWTGQSGFELRPRFDVPVHLVEADARYSRDRLELRGQFAQVAIDNAGRAERRDGPHVGRRPEHRAARCAASTPKPAIASSTAQRCGDVGVFARYENFDTQFRMPAGARAAPGLRSRRLGRRRHLLAGARHRGQGRLRRRPQPQHGRAGAQLASTSVWDGGSDASHARWMVLLVAPARDRDGASASAPAQAGAAEQTVEVTAERFASRPPRFKVAAGTTLKIVLRERRHDPRLPHHRRRT